MKEYSVQLSYENSGGIVFSATGEELKELTEALVGDESSGRHEIPIPGLIELSRTITAFVDTPGGQKVMSAEGAGKEWEPGYEEDDASIVFIDPEELKNAYIAAYDASDAFGGCVVSLVSSGYLKDLVYLSIMISEADAAGAATARWTEL